MTLQTGRAPRSALAWPPRWGLATVTPLTPTGCLGSRRPSAPVQPSLLLNGIRPGRFGPHGDVIVARPARPGSGRLSRPTRHPATVGGAVGGTVGRAGGALYSAATPSSRAILRSAVAMDPPRRAPGAPGEPSTACSRDLTTCRGPTRPLGPLGPGAVVARFSSLGDYINLHQPEGGTEGRWGGGGAGANVERRVSTRRKHASEEAAHTGRGVQTRCVLPTRRGSSGARSRRFGDGIRCTLR